MGEFLEGLFAAATVISQTGFALAAWRLVRKMDKRVTAHEEEDRAFHKQVRERLGLPEPKVTP